MSMGNTEQKNQYDPIISEEENIDQEGSFSIK